MLDVQVRSENGLPGIALLFVFPGFQGAFESLFEINTTMNWSGQSSEAQIHAYFDAL